MKKLINISLLLAVLCLAAPVYADGDMSTGSRTCTQNCGGLYEDSTLNPDTTKDSSNDETSVSEIYSWIREQISKIIG